MTKRHLPQPLEPDELRAILAVPNKRAPTGLRNRVMVALMAESGLRVGEVVALRMSHWDAKRDRLRIIDGKTGDRYVWLNETGSARLNAWLAEREKHVPDSPYVFPQIRSAAYRHPNAADPSAEGIKMAGTKLSTSYVRALCARLGTKARLPGGGRVERRTNPHAFRHTAATRMIEQGYSLPEVQKMLGHASVATTSIYLHVSDAKLAERVKNSKGIE